VGRVTEVHICRGVNRRFYAQVRMAGARRWQTVGKHLLAEPAIMRMAKSFAAGSYKRGRVIMTADYYEPVEIAEMRR
jgi:hypothetical protein